LDSVLVYPVDNDTLSGNNKIHAQTLVDLNTPILPPAQISGYKKINPTMHILSIENATRPYMISFAESYDPLWRAYAYIDNNKRNNNTDKSENTITESIPLYSITNGFYVNKTGDYSLIIEYQPQIWFVQGATVSLLFLVAMAVGFLLLRKRRTMRRLYLTLNKALSRYHSDKKTDLIKRDDL
jgi:hypothetical protein